MSKLYFASSSHRWQEVREWINIAKGYGHEITHDWTHEVEEHGRGTPLSSPPGALKDAAHNDRIGVYDCQVLINLYDAKQMGALIETGMAIALGRWVWVAADEAIRYNVFWELPQVELMTLQQLRVRLDRP